MGWQELFALSRPISRKSKLKYVRSAVAHIFPPLPRVLLIFARTVQVATVICDTKASQEKDVELNSTVDFSDNVFFDEDFLKSALNICSPLPDLVPELSEAVLTDPIYAVATHANAGLVHQPLL